MRIFLSFPSELESTADQIAQSLRNRDYDVFFSHDDLPPGDSMFPGGAAADAINNNCLACHSADMVLNQPALPKATWEAEVHKMIHVYKAPIDDADVPAIVDYLASMKGAQ